MLLTTVLSKPGSPDSPWIVLSLTVASISITLGFLTPVAAASSIALEVFAYLPAAPTIELPHICAILVALVLALLGPGGYSLDARIFGRRRLVFPKRDDMEDTPRAEKDKSDEY
jgi:uncharacterized membrane protein YphA (DoxX/SURF4 family)